MADAVLQADRRFKESISELALPSDLGADVRMIFLAALLHIADRWAFERYGAEERAGIVDGMAVMVFFRLNFDLPCHLGDYCNRYVERMASYPDVFPSRGVPPDGTLLWECAKAAVGEDPRLLLPCFVAASEAALSLLRDLGRIGGRPAVVKIQEARLRGAHAAAD